MAKPTASEKLEKEAVIAYLTRHPEFLTQNPELLEVLAIPRYQSGDRVLDMQLFTIDKLREQIDMLRRIHDELLTCSRDNMTAQAQVHKAAVDILNAEDLDELLTVIHQDLAAVFAVDAVQLCLETELGPVDDSPYGGINFLRQNVVEALLGKGKSAWLGHTGPEHAPVFGESASLVKSAVLVRFSLAHPEREGLIAFGSRDPSRFAPGQGTELLRFLAQVTERSLAVCLLAQAG